MNQILRRRNGPSRPLALRQAQNNSGNAKQRLERYLARAREAQLAGDMVEMENNYQHAEHYFRVIKEAGDVRSN